MYIYSMLKKIVIVALCGAAILACGGETKLDPTNPESIRKHYANMDPPVQMSNDQFVSYVKGNLVTIDKDTANMSMFMVCSKDYLNTPNSKGNTALSVAVNKKNPVVVRYLLERGADIGQKSAQLGLTPLEDAAMNNDPSENGIFSMLIDAQKRRGDTELRNIGAALHLAARYGALNNVRKLIEEGANPNTKSIEGLTPLHEAAKEGREAVVEYLISKKVEINPVDKDGYTPVDWACAMGEGTTYPKVGQILKKAGGKHTAAWRRAF